MLRKLKTLWVIFIAGTLVPLLILLPLTLMGTFEGNTGVIIFGIFISLPPLLIYYFLTQQIINQKSNYQSNVTILSITFYLNFLIYMIATLISFNLIIIGGFLFNGDVPMGMNLIPTQAPYLTLGGVYILAICICGMTYLAQSKKYIRSTQKK